MSTPNATAITLSDSDSTRVPKIFNPNSGAGPRFFQIWESDSGNHRCNRNSAIFYL